MGVLQGFECFLRFFFSRELYEPEASVVLRVNFLGQSYLFECSIRLEHFSNFLLRAFEGQILNHKLLR